MFKALTLAATLAAVSVLILAVPAWAHHSRVMYEPEQTMTVTGTVKEFNWSNPHSWLYVIVIDESGQTVEWVLEGNSAAGLARQGWRRDSLSPGDEISVSFRPMKDGSRAGLLGIATLNDGRTLSYRPTSQ